MVLPLVLLLAPECPAAAACVERTRAGVGDVGIEDVEGTIDGVPLARPVSRRLVHADGRSIGPMRVRASTGGSLPRATIDEAKAKALAAAHTGFAIESAELVADDRDGVLRPVWRVDPRPDPRTLAHPWIHVDAVTGAVTLGPDRSVAARARVFPRNPVLDDEAAIVELAYVEPGAEALRGTYFHGTNCGQPEAGFACALLDVPPDENGDWLPPAPDITIADDNEDPTDDFAAVSVFAHADAFMRFASEHGLGELPCPVTTLVANYRAFTADGWISFGNATYTGDCSLTAVFGQGAYADWGYDGDVVHHELTHGLIERLIGRGRFLGFRRDREEAVLTDALAINEGLADFVAAVVSGDAAHAEYVAQVGGSLGRTSDNAYVCPDDLVGEVHYDSEILSGALWSAYEVIGVELVRVVLLSVALLEEDTTFEEAAAIFVEVARDELGADAAMVLAEELAARGLDDCPRVAAWTQLGRPLWILPETAPGNSFDPMRPPAVQLAFTMPPDRTTLVVRWSIETFAPPMFAPDAHLEVLAKVGDPIAFSYRPDGTKTKVDGDPDAQITDANEGFTFEAPPGATVYVAIYNRWVSTVVVSGITATFEGEAGTESGSASESASGSGSESEAESESASESASEAGSGSASGSGSVSVSGCSCRAAGERSLSLLGLFLVGLLRSRSGRRRRTRSCRVASR